MCTGGDPGSSHGKFTHKNRFTMSRFESPSYTFKKSLNLSLSLPSSLFLSLFLSLEKVDCENLLLFEPGDEYVIIVRPFCVPVYVNVKVSLE